MSANQQQVSANSLDTNGFKEECIHLIAYNNQTQQFEISDEAKQMLSKVKGPLGVIAVAGMYRTGKSYLLNRMLLNRQRGGFGVGPSINPCTKGLWLWGTPVQGTTVDGHPVNVLVIDSEGIGGLDEDNNHDMRIFSLALLLSSYFLYNSVGSIDENALSSLSLVVNITKHIQLKSSSSQRKHEGNDQEEVKQDDSGDDLDEEGSELSDYLPSFMWVVRDFALQLVDEDGDVLTSKEYLERALTEKGAVDDSKNQIRRALKRYFKERQCCTMIRPLTNEEELQNLDRLPFQDLRAEFVEQVLQLRESVLKRIKPKSINGHLMDGTQWIQLVEIYVQAINQGAVPSIQSAWTYICKQSAERALDQAKANFESELSQFVVQLPMNQEDLESFIRDQSQALTIAIALEIKGDEDVLRDVNSQLVQYVNMRQNQILEENKSACRLYATDLLTQLFQELDQQFRQQLLPGGLFDLGQLDSALQEIAQIYDQNALDFGAGGAEKALLHAEARAAFLQDLLHQAGHQLAGEMNLQRSLDSQTRDRLESQIREAKEDARMERQRVEDRMKNLLQEKSEFEATSLLAKEQLEIIRASRDEETRDLRDELHALREQASNSNDIHREAKEELEERVQDLQRQKLQVESEFEKERALFDQKVEFLEKSLSEKADRERSYLSDLHSKRSELTGEMRTMCQKYELELKTLQGDLEEERERLSEAQTSLLSKSEELESLQGQWAAHEVTFKQMRTAAQDQVKSMEQALQAIRRESDTKTSQNISNERADTLQQQLQEVKEQAREAAEAMQAREHEGLKEKAIREQKIQFLELQLVDARRQLQEANRQHEHMVKAIKGGAADRDSDAQLSDQEETLEERVVRLQHELSRAREDSRAEKSDLINQIEQQNERLTEQDLQIKLAQNDNDLHIKDLTQQLSEIELQRSQLQERIKSLEQQRQLVVAESDTKYSETVERFELELEAAAQHSQAELREAQTRSEAALQQLRKCYESEKEKLETRITEERDRNTRRMAIAQEELESKMREEALEQDEEIESLESQLRDAEQRHQAYITQVEHELSLKHQLLEGFERQVREGRDRAENLEVGRNSAFERQIEHFEQQRQEYNQKIDRMQSEALEKDRTLAQLQLKMERQGDDLDRRKQEIEQSRGQFEKERKTLSEKLDITKKKFSDSQDDAMRQKLDYGREQALAKQQIEFQIKKIDDLQRQMDDSQKFYDEKIKQFRADVQDEAQSQIERITSEKELWENKYEQKRRSLKEIEQSLSKSNAELENRVNNLQQNADRLEQEKRQIEQSTSDQIATLQDQLSALDSSAGVAFYYGSAAHAEDVMKLRSESQDLERELSDLQCQYDRDKALLEGKCNFLEQQKDTYKRDLIESQKKFEITLEQLQKRGSMDKDKHENNQQTIIRMIESKCNAKLREMMDAHTIVVNEAQAKVRRHETELKALNDRFHLEQRGKHSEQGSLEKRVQDLAEAERRLQTEVEELKQERDRRTQDYHRQLDKEKETYRARLSEQEQKAKDAEKMRSQHMFEYEKERTRWQLEKDAFSHKIQELEEQVEKLVLQKENLMKENTRMKVESKNSKRLQHQQTPSYHNFSQQNQTTTAASGGHILLSNGSSMSTLPSGGQYLAPNASTSSAGRYSNMLTTKSLSGAVGGTIMSQSINKMKENSKPLTAVAPTTTTSNEESYQQQHNSMTQPLSSVKNYNRYANNQGGLQ